MPVVVQSLTLPVRGASACPAAIDSFRSRCSQLRVSFQPVVTTSACALVIRLDLRSWPLYHKLPAQATSCPRALAAKPAGCQDRSALPSLRWRGFSGVWQALLSRNQQMASVQFLSVCIAMGCCMPSQACKEEWVIYQLFLEGLFKSAVHLSVRLKKLNTLFRWLWWKFWDNTRGEKGGWGFSITQTFLGEVQLCLYNSGSVRPANCLLFLNVSLGLLFSVFVSFEPCILGARTFVSERLIFVLQGAILTDAPY